MSNKTVRTTGAIAGATIVIALAWVAGFDFNERGANSLITALFTLIGTLIGTAIAWDLTRMNGINEKH